MSQFTASNDEDHGVSAKAQTAAHEASAVTQTAGGAAREVVETSAHEAAAVASETKARFGDLVSQTGRELSDQAAGQQKRLAAGLGSVGDDLSRMADADENGGIAGDLVRRAAGHVSTVGSWLGDRDPQQLLHEVSSFARRRPGVFIAAAAIAGVVVGRLSRAIAAGAASDSGASGSDTPGRQSFAGSAAQPPALPEVPPAPDGLVATNVSTEPGVDDTGLVAGVDGGDPPLYTESAARLGGPRDAGTREGDAHERPDSL
ncbi:hypothetical protein [Microbacterium trichothecenolyticum]|uniref:Uncharacterized protein n=1 Tax=Microbacterium trichothecenolyticum TaxID=69370 RepID=A0ABU0TYS6_MICTR|nr:hypothetical protein [Microbacterium trichothecenolyticum]MDQ1124810.1 hypothetical protein [Microbacterium trichothecenolyticum]